MQVGFLAPREVNLSEPVMAIRQALISVEVAGLWSSAVAMSKKTPHRLPGRGFLYL
jgi:hypothetical protein